MPIRTTIDADRSSLGFATTAKGCFQFLLETGFQLEFESDYEIRYRSQRSIVSIQHDSYSYELDVEFQPLKEASEVWNQAGAIGIGDAVAFVENCGNSSKVNWQGLQTSSREGLQELLPKLANFVRSNCASFLEADSSAYLWVRENRAARTRAYAREIEVNAARAKAEELWEAKEYEAVIPLLQLLGNDRSASENMKLDYAMKRSSVAVSNAVGAKPQGATDEVSVAAEVQRMFNRIAPRYDLLNHVLSANIDKLWWRRTAKRFGAVLQKPDARVLDICCGTGDMTMALLKWRPRGAQPILAADFARAMLARGAEKFAARAPGEATAVAVEADALHLPVKSESLDLVVSAFGFRNLANYEAGLREFHRVLKPGGQLGILDFSEPGGWMGKAYAVYFRRVLPAIGRVICGEDGPYKYLPASVGNFPPPPRMLEMMRACGYEQCSWQPYTFGIAGLYTATRTSVS